PVFYSYFSTAPSFFSLSLHDALPIYFAGVDGEVDAADRWRGGPSGPELHPQVGHRQQAGHRTPFRSSASRSPSPNRLKPRVTRTMAAPGKTTSQGAWAK